MQRAQWKRAALFAIAATGAILLSRLPFLPFNPDWGRLVTEHCHLLSSPTIHAEREALGGEGSIPYYLVNPEQMLMHYHGGSACVSYAVWGLSKLLDTRTLLPLKVLGLACTLLYSLLMALILARVARPRRDRGLVWVPIFLNAFPPIFFLWVTQTPLGHFFESHLFYGLFVPFAVLAAMGRSRALTAAVLGLLGGLAIAYTLSNAVFVALLFAMLWLSPHYRLWLKLVHSALLTGGVAVVLSFNSTLSYGLNRVVNSMGSFPPGDGGQAVTYLPWNELLVLHATLLFGREGQVATLQEGDWGTALLLLTSGVLALAASGVLLLCLVRVIRPSSRRSLDGVAWFLAANGFLLAAFVAAYLLVDPYTHSDGTARIEYLAPIFPPLFVGAGALLDRALNSHSRWLSAAALALAAVCAVGSMSGWSREVRNNARPLDRPPIGSCDASQIHGFFWEEPDSPRAQWKNLGLGPFLDREDGELRCCRARPGETDACTLTGFALDAMVNRDMSSCDALPADRRILCTRAHSSIRFAAESCAHPLGGPPSACEELDAPLRAACVSGAFQGNSLDRSTSRCQGAFSTLCNDTFDTTIELAACMEQSAALLLGMPILPEPQGPLPDLCRDWPEPWQGLCEQATERISESEAQTQLPSCETIYLDRFSRELPHDRELPYHQCLFDNPTYYPYCAIGVARRLGEVDCRWSGEPDFSSFMTRTDL